jgi:hypothetical protein
MPGTAIGKALNYGYPGTVSRSVDAIISNRPLRVTDTASANFGDPVVLNTDNTYSFFGSTGTAAAFAGVAVREVKQSTSYLNSAQGTYSPGQPTDVIERGAVIVACNVGTPTAGGAVYIRIVLNGAIPLGLVGGFETAADGTNTILLTNAKWTTGKIDANKSAEITMISRNQP